MPSSQRATVQNRWQRGATRVVVATIAYGMGIDAPHVRFVVHFCVPKSVGECPTPPPPPPLLPHIARSAHAHPPTYRPATRKQRAR